ncbi:hypothetical protein TpMuguga_03g00641 [Theileria parva strain Muguga]|uniref:Uncharacterized protein n=1 Tax=Theileria parva TaxID=5875 RepID=Q4MZ50_THEPA|nr:uncharacterized protein TpMuguga_03g00641 [Theileria parva strain Muguga]EAN30482.1 hypothetical protein TpMuguga_03g00641 [Theileria parva strain Muguga]|eukprot:XP_762765.1 hypothetical protein [Theileria parva strain Muguga]
MDTNWQGKEYSSFNLNPYGTELVSNDFQRCKTAPMDHSEKVNLSGLDQSLQMGKSDLDETVLRNIMYCYEFLESADKEYINSAEAEEQIRRVRDENPPLFELLLGVLQAVSEFDSNDSDIAKNLFIKRLRDHINSLNPDDESSVRSLKNRSNPISDYFKLVNSFGSPGNYQNLDKNNILESVNYFLQSNLSVNSADSIPDSETVFYPKSDLYSYKNQPNDQLLDNLGKESILNPFEQVNSTPYVNASNDSVENQHEKVNKFENVNDYIKVLNSSSNVNEYIIFNYNQQLNWEETLRELC